MTRPIGLDAARFAECMGLAPESDMPPLPASLAELAAPVVTVTADVPSAKTNAADHAQLTATSAPASEAAPEAPQVADASTQTPSRGATAQRPTSATTDAPGAAEVTQAAETNLAGNPLVLTTEQLRARAHKRKLLGLDGRTHESVAGAGDAKARGLTHARATTSDEEVPSTAVVAAAMQAQPQAPAQPLQRSAAPVSTVASVSLPRPMHACAHAAPTDAGIAPDARAIQPAQAAAFAQADVQASELAPTFDGPRAFESPNAPNAPDAPGTSVAAARQEQVVEQVAVVVAQEVHLAMVNAPPESLPLKVLEVL
jgi:hypothetical protein